MKWCKRLLHTGPMEELCLACAHIVFSTVASAGRPVLQRCRESGWGKSRNLSEEVQAAQMVGFDAAVVDEASQLVEAETAIIIQVSVCR